MTDRLRRRLGSELDPLEPPPDLWDRARTREPGEVPDDRLRSRLTAGTVAFLIMAGAGVGAWVLLDRPSTFGSIQDPSEILEVICEDGETVVTTPVVVQQRDGVRIRMDNPDGAEGFFVRLAGKPYRSWARGALGERDTAEFTLPVPPGDMEVLCLHPPVNTLTVPDEEFTPLTVVLDERDSALIETEPYGEDLLRLGWPALEEELGVRLRVWEREIHAEEMSARELAAAMDVITDAITWREDMHLLELRELGARRGSLCIRLPAGHAYRGGEYCD